MPTLEGMYHVMAENVNNENGEQSVVSKSKEKDVAFRTNSRLRQKYFVEEKNIVSSIQKATFARQQKYSRVIRPGTATVKPTPVVVRCSTAKMQGDIQVDVVRDGQRITAIKISCPCGRHAELNCEYSS